MSNGHAETLSAHSWVWRTLLMYSSTAQVAFNQRGRNATQLNMGGTGIGTFNDRLRDAVMGGSPFAPSRRDTPCLALQLRTGLEPCYGFRVRATGKVCILHHAVADGNLALLGS